jgi:hypothetical protein
MQQWWNSDSAEAVPAAGLAPDGHADDVFRFCEFFGKVLAIPADE